MDFLQSPCRYDGFDAVFHSKFLSYRLAIMTRLGVFRIFILTVMLAAFGLRSVVPEGYMVGASEAGDHMVIELCSGIDTKFVRLNLSTGETETINPDAPEGNDEDPQSPETAQCLGALSVDLNISGSQDWPITEVFARAQAVVLVRRLSIARTSGLPRFPARGPPLSI